MKYNFELDLSEDNNLALLLSRVSSSSVVLEFGCANGRMTRYLKEELGCKVYGVEIDKEAAADATKYTEKIVVDNIENYSWKKEFENIKFDFIIFADVLEHLYDPKEVLMQIKNILKDEGSILISIPNVSHNAIVLNLLKNHFDYHSTGLLDDTHIRFFTKQTFDRLVLECGYDRCFERGVYATPLHTEFGNDYDELPPHIALYLQNLPHGHLYQIVYELKKNPCNLDSVFDDNYMDNYIQIDLGTQNSKDIIKVKSPLDITKLDQCNKIIFDVKQFDLTGKKLKSLKLKPFNGACVVEIKKISLINKGELLQEFDESLSHNAKFEKDELLFFDEEGLVWIDSINRNYHGEFDQVVVFLHYHHIYENALKNLILVQRDVIEDQRDFMVEQNDEIVHLVNLTQSMRIKNRLKNIIRKLVPTKLWNLFRYIRHNPDFLYKIYSILKNDGLKGFFIRLKNVGSNHNRYNFGYDYLTPFLSKDIKKELESFYNKPLISILMPVYNVEKKWLQLAIESIENQWYKNWELCIVDDKSTKQETLEYLQSLDNKKIKIKFLEENINISGASNEALKLSSGEFVALMDNDDELTPDALFEVVKAINLFGADFIYSDEDKLDIDNRYCEPHFKANFSLDMLYSQNYISHLCVIKKELIDTVGGWEIGLEGAQDYDLYLKVLEHTKKVYHIPKILYHWRKIEGSTAAIFDDKSYAQDAGAKALTNSLQRREIDGKVENGVGAGTYRVSYEIKNQPLVSIVIPFKDKPELLRMCIESILEKSSYSNFEIIGMSNNSEELDTFEEMDRLKQLDKRVEFYEYNHPFNYSQINNYAVNNYANGEHILLLNNDIEIITDDWIEQMLMHSQREDIGCVGAKLYYPDDTIQHAGVIIGLGGVAGHSHKYFSRDAAGYFYRLHLIQNLSAVTAACLMVKKSIFQEVNGLDEENLKIAFNDVDFCLRVQYGGYNNIFTPYCEAYHHESVSRGAEDNPQKIERFNKEVAFMQKKHQKILRNGDPYYNQNLTRCREDFGL